MREGRIGNQEAEASGSLPVERNSNRSARGDSQPVAGQKDSWRLRHRFSEKLDFLGIPRTEGQPGRDLAVDALRGFSILLVVLGHSIANATNLLVAPASSSFLIVSKFLYTFHMPLFFLISGYVMFGKRIRVRDRALRLLPPFLAWIPFYYLVNHYIHNWPATFPSSLWDTILHPAIGLWFLPTLFLCSLLLIPVHYLEGRWSRAAWPALIAIFIAVNLIPVDILGVMQVKYFFPFFAAGYLAAGHRPRMDRLPRERVNLGLLGASALFLLLFALLYYWGRIEPYKFPFTLYDLFHAPAAYLIRYFMAALGILLSVGLVRAVKAAPGRRALAWFGLVTMDIYVSHFLFLQITFASGWLKVLISCVTGVVFSLALALLVLRQWWVTAAVFLGIRRRPSASTAGPAATPG